MCLDACIILPYLGMCEIWLQLKDENYNKILIHST